MRHKRDELIQRANEEYQRLEDLISKLNADDWERLLPRPEGKDPWTVKDALVHITRWRADVVRSIRGQRRPPEERGLETNAANHLVYERWRDRPVEEVLAWHRQVQEEVLAALREAPEAYFSGKERNPQWPFDLIGHSAYHRERDIERALADRS